MKKREAGVVVGRAVRFFGTFSVAASLAAAILAFGIISLTAAVVVGLFALSTVAAVLLIAVPMAAESGRVDVDVREVRDGKLSVAKRFSRRGGQIREHDVD